MTHSYCTGYIHYDYRWPTAAVIFDKKFKYDQPLNSRKKFKDDQILFIKDDQLLTIIVKEDQYF